MIISENTITSALKDDWQNISVLKITALWAFSESAFGGILHALSVPFRGIFISSAAVLFISLISLFSLSRKEIIKSTLIVLLIKLLVSPHTPLTAYFAVTVQGLLGYLLFFSKKTFRVSAIILGVLTLFFSGIQKIIVLTLVFGNTLWQSINVFIKQVSKELFSLNLHNNINYGFLLIGSYIAVHLAAGIFIGLYAARLPERIDKYKNELPKLNLETDDTFPLKQKRKKKNWLLRPTGLIIFFISVTLLIYTYIKPGSLEIGSNDIIVMIIRSVLIMLIWFLVAAPIIKKLVKKYLQGKKVFYSEEINKIMDLFPQFKKTVAYCWKNSSDKKGLTRLRTFLSTSFYYLLLS